jgi:hypothetical protein
VLASAYRVAPLPRLIRVAKFLPWAKAAHDRRAVDRARLAQTIEKTLVERAGRQSLGVVCLGNSDEINFAVVAAALELQTRGGTVTIVDVTDGGTVAAALARSPGATVDTTPGVFRPSLVPSLADGPPRVDAPRREEVPLTSGKGRIALIVADLDPAIGVDHLTLWTDAVVIAVTAGQSSVELVRTAGELVRSVGLHLCGAVVLHAARDDTSSGVAARIADPANEAQPSASRGSSMGRTS